MRYRIAMCIYWKLDIHSNQYDPPILIVLLFHVIFKCTLQTLHIKTTLRGGFAECDLMYKYVKCINRTNLICNWLYKNETTVISEDYNISTG